MDIKLFQQKLNDICAIAEENNKQLSQQQIRDHFGKPLTITSAFRTAAHNKNVKGATYSQHCYGKAADIRVQGVSVEDVADYAETLLKNTGGIGRYPVKKGRPAGWVHVDVREAKSRWTL